MKADFYEVLSNVDVKDRIKQKNGLNYLSWMWAWHELKKRYPLSYATVHETEDGMLVWKDPNGAHVKTRKRRTRRAFRNRVSSHYGFQE